MASVEVREDNSGFVDNWQSGKSLAECNLHMLSSEDSCDVSFRVGKEEKLVRAHRYVLMSRSSVFHAMLCGPLAEKEEIKIPDVEEETFSEMLRYLYTDTSTPTAENVTGVLYLAKKYAVGGLERLCLTYLESSLTAENACVILEQAHVFDEEKLLDRALKVIVQNGDVAIQSSAFTALCHTCFHKIVSAADFVAKPETVFSAAMSWCEDECKRHGREITRDNKRLVLGDSVYDIDFTAMDAKEFVRFVVPSGVLSNEEYIKLLCFFTMSEGDVAPFKIKPKQLVSHSKVSLYKSSVYSKGKAQTSVIIIKCYDDLRLLGFVVYGSGDCSYDIKLEHEIGASFQDAKQAKLSGKSGFGACVKLHLNQPFILERCERYRIHITMASGETVTQGSSLLSEVFAGSCRISVSKSGLNKTENGLISHLILENT
ncbi:BTB/POZ domain-containing protein 6-like isoform X2 [Haliotis rufescens]|uniref:BTB/POZ domain-containing protein 6-like isoform X2 n=1 Tax=Haliotis rufescens TaxID=6454 RepID=UPI00201F619D|nr:BTB/POZ domain-containing protein 6-like isoform X2 [Haliotis rufescens]